MGTFQVVRHSDVYAFAERATGWLLQAEAEHNLLLSIIEQVKANRPGYANPYLVTVELGGDIVGCAFRTPPFKLGLTRMPHGAIPELVMDVLQVYEDLPAVLGPAAQARAFAEAWAICRGKSARPGMSSRIYQLDAVQQQEAVPGGSLRLASRRDLDLLVSWLEAFSQEAKVGAANMRTFAENHINNKTVFLWEDGGEPCTSALYAGKTPNGVRIGFVYTPAPFRRRGYASACVAGVSQRALDNGNRFCFLYTDLNNPTSNSIYQRIGYTPVCDVIDYEII